VSLPQPNDIDVICVACGARVRIRRGQAGRVYKCPKCTEDLPVGKSWDEAVAELLAGPAPPVNEPASHVGSRDVAKPQATPPVNVPASHVGSRDAAKPQAVAPQHSEPSDDEYRVLPGVDQPPPGSAAHAKYFPVICPVCHTRLYATEEQVGEMIECPDCRRSVKVPPPPPPKPKPKRWSEDDGVPVPISAAVKPEAAFDAVKSQVRLQPRDEPEHEETPLPEWPLVKGVFSFPGYFTVWPRWIAYSLWMALVLVLVHVGINLLINSMANGIYGAGMAIGAVLCITVSSIAGGSLWMAISGLLLAVLEDTSDGLDKIENWPETIFSNLKASVYTFNALTLSALPGFAVSSIFIAGGEPKGWVATPASAFFLFPIMLLSMLAKDSPMIPFDRMIWRGTKTARGAWLFFYLETLVVLGPAAAAAVFAWWRGGIWLVAGAAVVIMAALLIYFRLLGRLGWISAMQAVDEDEESADGDKSAAEPAGRAARA
jgi:hypothetical protein